MSDIQAIGGTGFALLAAVAYGFAGVVIARGKPAARGDNGVFLSVALTAFLTGFLWFGLGTVPARELWVPDHLGAVGIFALAGLFSTVLGRATMYRATERIGAVRASLLRRLTPVFALPIAMVVLSELPGPQALAGAALVLGGVVAYLGLHGGLTRHGAGLWIGLGSAAFYAAAYVLRRLGLETLPDALLGTLIGALVGCLWFPLAALAGNAPSARLRRLLVDRGRWHWLGGLALSLGQICQFFALKSAPVVVVAALGTLEVLFAALFGFVLTGGPGVAPKRLALTLALAVPGTVLLLI